MASELSGSIVVVTGAARGIGLEFARQLTAKGARVFATARDTSRASHLKAAVGNHGKVLELDISDDESVEQFALDLAALVGHVDWLVNNAGVYLDGEDAFESLAPQTVLETLDINSVGPLRVTQALLPLLRASKKGARVASLSSLMGSIADTSGGSFAYRMSKAAVNMFVKCFANEEREMIALALHPGWVQTEMGGARAPLAADKSVEGMLTVIESATTADSGKFFNHAGRELPW